MRRSLVLGCVLLASTCIFVAGTARPETPEWKNCKEKYKKAQTSSTPSPTYRRPANPNGSVGRTPRKSKNAPTTYWSVSILEEWRIR